MGPNKFIAKLASDYDKPDGLTVVRPHEVLVFISDLPVKKLWGVGPATAKRLDSMGLETIGQVAATPLVELEQRLADSGDLSETLLGARSKTGKVLRPARSRGAETTFSTNISDKEELHQVLRRLAQRVSSALVKTERPARTLTLKARYPDFETVSRSITLERATWDAEEIGDVACQAGTDGGPNTLRSLGKSAPRTFTAQPRRPNWSFLWSYEEIRP